VTHLQADVAGDITTALVLATTCGGMIAAGGVPWWFIVPLLGTIIDVYQSPILAINNTAEKPFYPTRGST
jgi:cell division protein FtsW (lipid II flippase)